MTTSTKVLERLALQATKESILLKVGQCPEAKFNMICESLNALRLLKEEIASVTLDRYTNSRLVEAAKLWVASCSRKIDLLDKMTRRTLQVSVVALEDTIQCQLAHLLKRVIG